MCYGDLMSQAMTMPAKRAATYADLATASDLLIAAPTEARLTTDRAKD
jgi:hypothetical protein